jgi:pimeloyl-ACP methyl ester carboxylesterase
MSANNRNAIGRMEWNEFEAALRTTTTRGAKGGATNEKALRDYFGDEEFEELKELAKRAQAARTRDVPRLGNVIMLPGIMGSNLISSKKGNDDLIWVNLFRIALGRVARLRLTADGSREEDGDYKVSASIIDKRTYTRAMLKLSARWDIQPYAFDWRKDIDESSKGLKEFISNKFKDKPVHLVAHSMGGLVARNFIRMNKELWEKMRGDGAQGGRLVMMGTPNFGSFSIPQVMTGAEKMVRWLSKLDLSHSLTEVLDIINTFVGSYQMLPAPDKISEKTIYRQDTWGDYPVSETHLARAAAFHEGLKDPTTINPERMVYIAGCNRETLARLTVNGPGDFTYYTTYEGDGRVPFSLGLLDNVRTYYVEEDHGSLPKNEKVIGALDEILERGSTSMLSTQPVVTRSLFVEGDRWHRSIGEHQTGSDLEEIAKRAKKQAEESDKGTGKQVLTPEEQRAAEETLMRAIMGDARPSKKLDEIKEANKEEKVADAQKGPRQKLHIEVQQGDVRQVDAPVIVVGHYKGVVPINAVGKLDEALGYWISQAGQHAMIGAELGQVFFIPIRGRQIKSESVLLAGMGEEGKFSRYDLRYLMLNVTYAISALDVESFATVLIGSGAGGLDEKDAIRNILFGICDALHRLPRGQRLSRVIIIERNPERYESIYKTLGIIKDEDSAKNLDITVSQRVLPKFEEKIAEDSVRPADLPEAKFGPRMTIARDASGDVFEFSALTEKAIIPVRQVEIQGFFSDGIANRLMASNNRDEQLKFGRLLHTSLVPEDFQQILDTDKPLTLILDQTTASIPWEMGCFNTPSGPAFFGPQLKVTRQFRTLLSSSPGGISPQLNNTLRVLVIADPAPETELQLPGAREEGRAVVRVLGQIKQDWGLDIEVIDCIGSSECDPVEVLALILNGGFDVLHYAGHGFFDEKNPSRGGWVFGENITLSAREIFRARHVPRVVFANACFSAVVNKGKTMTAKNLNRNLASIAEAFFERGVQNYLGSGWPVQDDLALTFATTFYKNALVGRTDSETREEDEEANPKALAEAIAEARLAIMHDGSTWGAYQHYGDPNDLLMPKLKDRKKTAQASASKGASKAGTKKSGRKRGAGAKKSTSKAAGKKAPRKRAK